MTQKELAEELEKNESHLRRAFAQGGYMAYPEVMKIADALVVDESTRAHLAAGWAKSKHKDRVGGPMNAIIDEISEKRCEAAAH